VPEARVTIVGGGPAGLQAARFLGRRGISVVLLEEHSRVGLPQHCTSLVSLEGLRDIIKVSERRVVANRLRGAWIVAPDGTRLLVERSQPVAAVLKRPALEEVLLEEAASRAEILLGRRAELEKLGGQGLVVNATGVTSLLRESHGAGRYVLPALQYDLALPGDCGGEHVFIFLGERFSRGLFAWAVPLSEKVYRVGLASKGDVMSRLELLLKSFHRLTGCPEPVRRLAVYGGAVYTGGMLKHLLRGSTILIGDAAGQTKPTTGGGLVYLSLAAQKLTEAVRSGNLAIYERAVVRELGAEMKAQLLVRRLLNSLSDRELSTLVARLKREGAEELISREGSMDRQASVALKIAGLTAARAPTLALSLLAKLFLGLLEP